MIYLHTHADMIAIDTGKVKKIKASLPQKNILKEVIKAFKALSDPTRAKILYSLQRETLCVRDIAILAGISESATSHQLAYLKKTGFVSAKREGTIKYYSVSYRHLSALLKEAEYYADHIKNKIPDHPY